MEIGEEVTGQLVVPSDAQINLSGECSVTCCALARARARCVAATEKHLQSLDNCPLVVTGAGYTEACCLD